MKDDLKVFAVYAAAILVLIGTIWFGFAKWSECRRVHPARYCLTEK